MAVDDQYTLALLHCDLSTDETGKLMTPYGGAQIGANGFIGGAGKYVLTPYIAAFLFSGDFTVEGYLGITDATPQWMAGLFSTSAGGGNGVSFCISNGKPAIYIDSAILTHTTALPTNGTQVHVAYGRQGTTWYISVGGVVVSAVNSTTIANGSYAMVGHFWSNSFVDGSGGAYYLRGTQKNLKISNICRYTANFTPPTTFAVDANTIFLTNFDKTLRTGVDDESGKAWSNSGVSPSTAHPKFGNAALHVPAGTSNISCTSADFARGTGDWTAEIFAYMSALPTNRSILMSFGSSVFIAVTSSGRLRAVWNNSNNWADSADNVFVVGAPRHVRIDYTAGTLRAFYDGNLVISASAALNISDTAFYVGSNNYSDNVSSADVDYDEFRFSSVRRDAGNFAVPSVPFGAQSPSLWLPQPQIFM